MSIHKIFEWLGLETDQLKEAIKNKDKEIRTLEGRLDEDDEIMKELDAVILANDKEIEDKDKELQRLEAVIVAKDKEIENFIETLDRYAKRHFDSIGASKEDKEETEDIKWIQEQRRSQQNEIARQIGVIKDKDKEIGLLNHDIDTAIRWLDAKEAKIERLKAENDRLKQRVKWLEAGGDR